MEDRVIKVFAECTGKDASEIAPETRIDEDLEMKSLDKFALLAMLEAEFGTAPDGNLADPWNLVSDWISWYEQNA